MENLSAVSNGIRHFRRPEFSPNFKQMTSLFTGNDEYLNSLGIFRTKNQMGFSYMKTDPSLPIWIASLPESDKPLLDLGAGLGFQTETAIKSGRNVISVDAGGENLEYLRCKIEQETLHSEGKKKVDFGRLVNTIEAVLPNPKLFEKKSSSGVLLSEVIHFMQSKDVLSLFVDVFQWLESGGLLVLTTASPTLFRSLSALTGSPRSDPEMNILWDSLQNCTDGDLILKQPFKLSIPIDQSRETREIICRSTNELFSFATLAGFQVKHIDYISVKGSPVLPGRDEITLLVAQKPSL